MFIELVTYKGETISFNTENIVLITPEPKGTVLVDVNGMDWLVVEPYEKIKCVLQTYQCTKL